MVDLLVPPLHLALEVNQLPQVVGVHVLDGARPHLHLGHRDQHLVSDDLNLGSVGFAGGALRGKENGLRSSSSDSKGETQNLCGEIEPGII